MRSVILEDVLGRTVGILLTYGSAFVVGLSEYIVHNSARALTTMVAIVFARLLSSNS